MADIKTVRKLLTSGTRTATIATIKQTDAQEQSLRVYVNVSAASGTGGLTVVIRGYDPTSGLPCALTTGGGAITTTGIFAFEMMPSSQSASAAVKETVGRALPYVWDVQIQHGDSSNYTYSVGAEILPG
jgi:uncharacterized membrane protein